ncbi:MAG: outer membrane protein assembly factor BamD [Desulfobacteraceae bacterium]|jgi:outer membrane protein assembly factor BamD
MNRSILVIRNILVGTMVMFLLGGCSLYEKYLGGKEDKRPAELMSEGMKNFERSNYEEATEAFQQLKDRYPYSKYAIMAELKMADGLYEREEFEEAYTAYDDFEKLHPKNESIPYVIYQKGMCNFRQVTAIDRDQSFTLKAKEEFDRLVRRFPSNEYANRARKNIRQCFIYLAEYELYVGHFYYKMGKYRTAMNRYTYLIQNYPDMGQYHEALDYINRCKEKLKKQAPPVEETEKEDKKEKKSAAPKMWTF